MTQKDLKTLREKLPSNGVGEIVEETGFSRAYVNMVLAGSNNNLLIIDCAIAVAANYQNELAKKSEAINSL